jgi:hypothetical protein
VSSKDKLLTRFLPAVSSCRYQEDIEGQTEEERKLLKPVYRAQIETMVLHDKTTIFVNFEHVIDHDRGLATSIQDDLYR